MTGIGKILVFLNLIVAAALLTWGLSAYANSPNWVDSKNADGTAKEGEISLLKKEIDKYTKAATGSHDSYARKNVALTSAEATRELRYARLDAWLMEAKGGEFYPLPTMEKPNDAVIDTSASDLARKGQNKSKAILGPDNLPLKGLDALQGLYKNELDDRKLLLDGKAPATATEWMNPTVLLAPARMADLGIGDLRRLHAWVSSQMKVTDVAIDKQRVIQANLLDETAYLGDKRIDWTAQLVTLDQRNKQLKDRLKTLEK